LPKNVIRVLKSKCTVLKDGRPYLAPSYGGLFEPRELKRRLLLKSYTHAGCLWSISSHFRAIHSWNVRQRKPKIARKITKTPYL